MARHPNFRNSAVGFTAILLAVPLCVAGCSGTPVLSPANASLQTAAGSNVLAAPTAVHFTVEPTATGRLREQSGEMIVSNELSTSGSLTLTDGVITEADIFAAAAGVPDLSFRLTEPIVLRRDGQSGESIDAVGTLVVGTLERRGTTIRLTPNFQGDTAQLTATIAMPESLAQSFPDDSRVLEVAINLNATQ